MLAFLLLSVPFAFVCTALAFIGQKLTLSGGLIPIISDHISLVGAPLPSPQLTLSRRGRWLVLVLLLDIGMEVRIFLYNHDSSFSLRVRMTIGSLCLHASLRRSMDENARQ
jgi:hypothetical protein